MMLVLMVSMLLSMMMFVVDCRHVLSMMLMFVLCRHVLSMMFVLCRHVMHHRELLRKSQSLQCLSFIYRKNRHDPKSVEFRFDA